MSYRMRNFEVGNLADQGLSWQMQEIDTPDLDCHRSIR